MGSGSILDEEQWKVTLFIRGAGAMQQKNRLLTRIGHDWDEVEGVGAKVPPE